MTSNGLLLKFAALTALALIVCLNTSTFAQGIGGGQLIYNDTLLGAQIDLGNTVTITAGVGGNTTITASGTGNAFGGQTNGQDGIVFENTGNSYITADTAGAEVSTTSADPAILNGRDNSSVQVTQREYRMMITFVPSALGSTDGALVVEYGWAYVGDPYTAAYFNPLRDDDPVPTDVTDFTDIIGAVFDANNVLNVNNVIYTGPGSAPGVAGTPYVVPAQQLMYQYLTEALPEMITHTDTDAALEADLRPGGGAAQIGYLVINERNAVYPKRHRYDGDDRTLIESAGIAIENHGTLIINDVRIQTSGGGLYYGGTGGTVGILHEYSRGLLLDEDGNVDGITSNYGGEDLILNNTQIGEPGGASYTYIDPITGLPVVVPYGGSLDTSAITTRLYNGDKVSGDGINGRITVGQNVTMDRYSTGTIYHYPGLPTGTNTQAQATDNDISSINGPSVGIHAQAHALDPARAELVYQGGYHLVYGSVGLMDYSRTANTIALQDNSFIFANTGISFGAAGGDSSLYNSGILIQIDNTSGIFSPGGSGESFGTGGYINYVNTYGSYGITDRYSLLHLTAQVGDATHVVDGTGYSGSMHEIQVDGKVITGTQGREGIQINFNTTGMAAADKAKLKNIYYVDISDPNADRYGHVYYDPDDPNIVAKFVAYNTQPDRVFYLKINGQDPVPLTYFDEKTQRWTVHPDAPTIRINTGYYASRDPQAYAAPFNDALQGIGIDIIGSSIAYEGVILPPSVAPWSIYYGPTVRQITALGDDALIEGGQVWWGGAAMHFGYSAHVGEVIIGENNDVSNLSKVLFDPYDTNRSARNFQAFDLMTVTKRANFLYDPAIMYRDPDGETPDEERFHFDNAGVHGDIISEYNAVVSVWTGTGGTYSPSVPTWSFWTHSHPGAVHYWDEILGVAESSGPSYLLGHRDDIHSSPPSTNWTAGDYPGTSLILDEILLYSGAADGTGTGAGSTYYWGYAIRNGSTPHAQHFREALTSYLHHAPVTGTALYAGMTDQELMEGYTRDGTLIVFTAGDIFSGNIYGGGWGDSYQTYSGNIDLRFIDGTTIFNHNVIEYVNSGLNSSINSSINSSDASKIVHDAGIRVRDVYVEPTGHLLLNDAEFAVNSFVYTWTGADLDYADRLVIHDVLNEGIISGNGTFQIAERWSWGTGVNYFEGAFINRGILAPGLPGYIGGSEAQAKEIEKTFYNDMMNLIPGIGGQNLWEEFMRGVPGGQFGVINVFGSLGLMDEITRPNPNIYDPHYDMDEYLPAGVYQVTIGNDTIRDVFGKYTANIAGASSTFKYNAATNVYEYDPSLLKDGEISKEDWQVIATEKLGTHLSWFSPAAMIDKNTHLPLLTQFEQFEYLTNPQRREELNDKMLQQLLTKTEYAQYKSNPAKRAELNYRLLTENNIKFQFTELDALLWRFGFSDIVTVQGTVPPYLYNQYGWEYYKHHAGSVPPYYFNPPYNSDAGIVGTLEAGKMLLGLTQLGGDLQVDRIYDLDDDAAQKAKQTSFIIITSEGYTNDGSIKHIYSATTDWVYANVDLLPTRLETGQTAAVLTVIDDPHYYKNRVRSGGGTYNAQSVAGALDQAMLTNPGLAASFQFGLNSPEVLNDVLRQTAASTRANSVVMNLWSPSEGLFNQIGYGQGGMSTGNRGNVVFRNMQNGELQQPYGRPGVPPPGSQYAPPMAGQYRGQSPFYRTGSVWGAYNNASFSMGDDDNSFHYVYDRNGATIGSEWNLTPSSVIGGVAMVSETSLKQQGDKVKSFDYDLGVYFVCAPFEQFEVKSYAGVGFQSYKSDRYIRNSEVHIGYRDGGLFGIDDHYDSDTQGYSFNYAVEFARPFTMSPNFVIRPAAGFEVQCVQQDAYSEQMNEGASVSWSNNGLNSALGHETRGAASGTYGMSYKKMDFSRSLVRFGVNTESYFARGGWQFRGYYVSRLTGDKYPISEQSFTSGSSNFIVHGTKLGSSYYQAGLGSHLWLNQERTATLFLDGDWNFSLTGGGYNRLSLSVGFQQNF